MRERINLIGESSTPGGLSISSTAFDFVLGAYVSDLGIAVAQDGLEMHLAEFGLVEEDFEPVLQSGCC